MATKRESVMTCWQCPRYDREARRCRDGKANPKKKADTVAVAELLGLQMLCHYNPYRDALALRKHFPHLPAAIAASQSKRRSRRNPEPTQPPEENPKA